MVKHGPTGLATALAIGTHIVGALVSTTFVTTFVGTLAGCVSPTLQVKSEPGPARLLLDGEPIGVGEATKRQPYYGTMRVEAVTREALQRKFDGKLVHVTVNEPITPWIFPFDLLLEVATYPWRDQTTEVVLELPQRLMLPEGDDAPGIEDLKERAAEARNGR